MFRVSGLLHSRICRKGSDNTNDKLFSDTAISRRMIQRLTFLIILDQDTTMEWDMSSMPELAPRHCQT